MKDSNYIRQCILYDKAKGKRVIVAPAIFVTQDSYKKYGLTDSGFENMKTGIMTFRILHKGEELHYQPFASKKK